MSEQSPEAEIDEIWNTSWTLSYYQVATRTSISNIQNTSVYRGAVALLEIPSDICPVHFILFQVEPSHITHPYLKVVTTM